MVSEASRIVESGGVLMPGPDVYKSKAQARFFHAAMARGDIKKASVDRRDKNTNFKKLVKRVAKKK